MDNSVTNAVSKFRQSESNLCRMTEKALGKSIQDFSSRELSGGMCNAVYLIEADGRKMVLKIAPEASVTMMRHEQDILSTEAKMLEIFDERLNIPAPKLIYFDESCSICSAPYFFMSFVEGQSLLTINPRPDEKYLCEIKREIGVICREISSLKADQFGIPAIAETFTDNNCDFMLELFRMLLQDASDKDIEVPGVAHEELLNMLEAQRTVLNEIEEPRYIHTDTWDGNLMVKDNRLAGLVDFAAVLYGDPLMNHDFHDFSPEPRKEFLEGYGKTEFTKNELVRISIYKVWQRLGMIVERGYRNYDDKNQYFWVLGEFSKEIEHLKETLPYII